MPSYSVDINAEFIATRTDPSAPELMVEDWPFYWQEPAPNGIKCILQHELIVDAEDDVAARQMGRTSTVMPVAEGWSFEQLDRWPDAAYELSASPSP